MRKYKALENIIVVISFMIIFLYNFLIMWEIEEIYGDLEQFYHLSRNGDIMMLGDCKKVGIVYKKNHRIYVLTQNKDSIDLYNWVYDHNFPIIEARLLRPKNKIEINELSNELVKAKINEDYFKYLHYYNIKMYNLR